MGNSCWGQDHLNTYLNNSFQIVLMVLFNEIENLMYQYVSFCIPGLRPDYRGSLHQSGEPQIFVCFEEALYGDPLS